MTRWKAKFIAIVSGALEIAVCETKTASMFVSWLFLHLRWYYVSGVLVVWCIAATIQWFLCRREL